MVVQEKLHKVQIVAASMLVLQILSVTAVTTNNANETHQVPYSVGKTKTVCVPSINYTSCTHPGMKLNYHPPTSNNTVGILVYNILYNYRPDKVVARGNTFGFENVTSERNDSTLCVHFIKMSESANGLEYSLEQICGVIKLHLEKTFSFKFALVASTNPPPTAAASTKRSGFLTNTSTSSAGTSQEPTATDNERRNKNISTGAIVGIVVGVAAAVVILVIVVYCIRKQLSKRRHSRQVETQDTGILGSSSPNNNITAINLETR